MKRKCENLENNYETVDQFLERGGKIIQYPIPKSIRCKYLEPKHTRPKGIPMLQSGCSWVCGLRRV